METTTDIDLVAKARMFAKPLLGNLELPTGESIFSHALAVENLIGELDGTDEMKAAVYLAFTWEQLTKPKELLGLTFDAELAEFAMETHRIFWIQRHALYEHAMSGKENFQIENVRRMLLSFSRDLRVIILLMTSQLQNLRFTSAFKTTGFERIARVTLDVFAPLANRLGIWQIKWEMEDLAFRILEPDVYREVAKLLDSKRDERESEVAQMSCLIRKKLLDEGIESDVQGRAKHIYSIVKKMRGKLLDFEKILDLRALRIIVSTIDDCYRTLSWVHDNFEIYDGEYDDYIARPKPNGYQSLHTVVINEDAKVFEIQIRTQAMHEHAEFGVAAHWAYKEAGVKGYAGVVASHDQTNRIAVIRQLLAWEREINFRSEASSKLSSGSTIDEKIYVLTPNATIVELPRGSTPIDFAYSLHTELGHRCRGAKINGSLVPLHTVLSNGQTVEISTVKEGGPSRDWLNLELGFMISSRARSKVRAWFNAQKSAQTVSRGRELVEKLLQREGRTSLKLEDLAKQLGFDSAAHLFEVVGKDEFSLRHIELLLRPAAKTEQDNEVLFRKVNKPKGATAAGRVLVVGVDSLLTQLSRCCRPAPPDGVNGYVTRGKGISVHRTTCRNFIQLAKIHPDRVIDVAWASEVDPSEAKYPVDIQVLAIDRQGLLRDISEIFAKERMNVVGVKTQSIKDLAWMTFTIEVHDASKLNKVLNTVKEINGIQSARRLGAT